MAREKRATCSVAFYRIVRFAYALRRNTKEPSHMKLHYVPAKCEKRHAEVGEDCRNEVA
jgi:hypothetical protein